MREEFDDCLHIASLSCDRPCFESCDCAVDLGRSTTSPAKPFLKWPGGKTKLLPEISKYIPSNFHHYHEVCLGGGALFFYLRSHGYTSIAHLYDLNRFLIDTYVAIQGDVDGVVEILNQHISHHSKEYYLTLRGGDWNALTKPELAARMIYINRACFNGLYRVNRKGQCNSPWGKRDRVTIDVDNLYRVSKALSKSILIQGDFGNVLKYAHSNDFCFIDPPYPNNFTAYTSIGFNEFDHKRLHEVCLELDRRNVMFIQSNSDCDFIRQLYRDFQIVSVQARRNINCRKDGRGNVGEVVVMNY